MNTTQCAIPLGRLTSSSSPSFVPYFPSTTSMIYAITTEAGDNAPPARITYKTNVPFNIQEKCVFDVYEMTYLDYSDSNNPAIAIPVSGNDNNFTCENKEDDYKDIDLWQQSFKQAFITHNEAFFGNNLNLDPKDVSSVFKTDTAGKYFCHFEIDNHSCDDFAFTIFAPYNTQVHGTTQWNVYMSFLNKDSQIILNGNDAKTVGVSDGEISAIQFKCPDDKYHTLGLRGFDAHFQSSNCTTNPAYRGNEQLIFKPKDGFTEPQKIGNFGIEGNEQENASFDLKVTCFKTINTSTQAETYSLETSLLNSEVSIINN